MLTRFNDVYDFEKEFQAIVAQDVKYDGDKTEVKVFIPALMPNIMQGAAGYSRVNNRGCKQVFVNAKGTEPQIHDNYIEEKNYLIARIDPNSNIDVISLISSDTLIKEFKVFSSYVVASESNAINSLIILIDFSLNLIL